MIPELAIQKLDTGLYECHCEGTSKSSIHESIAAAIQFYGDEIPREFARHVEVNYSGVEFGTILLSRMAKEPSVVADEIVELVAEVFAELDDMKCKNSASTAYK